MDGCFAASGFKISKYHIQVNSNKTNRRFYFQVVSLPTRIDPHQTSAVVTLHGQLFVRVPFEMSDL
jgi:hypothetical protein